MVPLFFELREITEDSSKRDILEILFHATSTAKNKATFNQFKEGLSAGVFIIILDALDEVNHEYRDRVFRSIQDLIKNYPETPVIVSTRPDQRVETTTGFSVIRTRSMTLEQILNVIDRVEYNNEVKSKVSSELKNGLYEKHKSFLSNPLLATIMLITYDYSADIPSKISLFYKQAFEALYQRHDAHKGGLFKRGHYAKLPLDEFERLFSAFCYITYIKSKFEFSDSELLSFTRDAVSYCNIAVDIEKFVRDLLESVCLIQKEGLDNIFSHRSFQEYFTALFLANYRGDDHNQVIKKAIIHYNDNVIQMLHELSPDVLQKEYILPELDRFISASEKIDLYKASGLNKFLNMTIGSFSISSKNGEISSYGLPKGSISLFFNGLSDIYQQVEFSFVFFNHENPKLFSDKSELLNNIEFNTSALKILRSDFDGDIPVSPNLSEAKWLIYTDMPERLSSVRGMLTEFRERILRDLSEKDSIMRKILLPGD
jgi:hypothetical protein